MIHIEAEGMGVSIEWPEDYYGPKDTRKMCVGSIEIDRSVIVRLEEIRPEKMSDKAVAEAHLARCAEALYNAVQANGLVAAAGSSLYLATTAYRDARRSAGLT